MTMQDVLKQIIKETIAPLLKKEGFRKQGNNFVKAFSEYSATLNIQSSKWNTRNEAEFCFNTGIYVDKLFGTVFLYQQPSFPLEVNSVLRITSAELSKNNSWYRLTKDTDIQQLKLTITKDICEHIVPHFHQFENIHDVIKIMELREKEGFYENPHYLTVLYYSIGNMEKAQQRMTSVFHETKLDTQMEFTRELANRLGLQVTSTSLNVDI
ncbi:DUF4304 domain-containing protein [Paenibacillus sp. GSMTC-2017]|uniref:DUF4304 domain-containing protein n=1 Tax=Paenibacillus sp. GSMTC-2017 TaxID=2794350 RepID=UPI0018D60B44|nr:DUF4304 domain-containing protein [Paenibacillus sp. GSMTC-2017]MBH5316492.1 DUF4304 domain-containing protein [Paenibacillus sp. GSMTC-2017]